MRRSRSLSNIPLPCNAKRDSKAKRAKSTLRNSRDKSLDVQTPLAHRYAANTPLAYRLAADWSDQKYKTQRNVTPTYSGYKRTGSVSSFGSRLSLTKNISPLEKKTMQKLLNDKKWVAEQYSKIQEFIQTSGLFNAELSGLIRPPTINIFVEIMSVLFRQIIKTDAINTHNYADVTLKTLKLLNYPGTLTLSAIKTANTMHGWPHFISITSWLIERLNINLIYGNFKMQQEEELKQMFCLQDSVLEFLFTQHAMFLPTNSGPASEDYSVQSEKKLFEAMSVYTGINCEDVESLEEPIDTCRAEVNELDAELKEIIEENERLDVQNFEREVVIKKFKDHDNTNEEDLEIELSQLRKLLHKETDKKKDLVLAVKELEDIVSSQSCRHNEKAKILGQIEDLKRAIGRKERNRREYGALREKLDHDLSNLVREIEAKVDAWNVSIAKTLLPEMQNLRLRGKGYSYGFFDELKKIRNEKENIEVKLLNEFEAIKIEIEKLQKKKETAEHDIRVLQGSKEKLDSLRISIKNITEENRNLLSKIDQVKKMYDTDKMEKEHYEANRIQETETEISELDDRIQKTTKEIDKSGKKGISIITETHRLAIQNMKIMDDYVHSMVKDVTKEAAESHANLETTYKYLLSIQGTVASMSQDSYEGDKENLKKIKLSF